MLTGNGLDGSVALPKFDGLIRGCGEVEIRLPGKGGHGPHRVFVTFQNGNVSLNRFRYPSQN